jgi:hypothetical protein
LDLHGHFEISFSATLAGQYRMNVMPLVHYDDQEREGMSTVLMYGSVCANAFDARVTANGFAYNCNQEPDCLDSNRCPILPNNPFPIVIRPAEYSAKCNASHLAHDPETAYVVAGQSNEFTIQAWDQFGNKRMLSPFEMFVVNIRLINHSNISTHGRVTESVQGGTTVYSVDYIIETTGEYSMDILILDRSASRGYRTSRCCCEPNILVTTRATATANTVTQPEDKIFAGEDTTFSLASYDRYHNLRTDGGDIFFVELISLPEEYAEGSSLPNIIVPCEVSDLHTGHYLVEYSPTRSGAYSFRVTLNGEHQWHSLYALHMYVVAAERSPAKCIAEGAGLVGGQHAKNLALLVISKGTVAC